MSNRRQLLNEAQARLAAKGASDARLDAQWMLAHALGLSRLTMLMALDTDVPAQQEAAFDALLTQRAEGRPLQYVLGEAPFMGHLLSVSEGVLIPRADTETLCEAAIQRLRPGLRVLDIGTGSGALAVSIALAAKDALVTGVDISLDALQVAQSNAAALGAKVRFVQSDLFAALDGEMYDMIVSNPPYIPSGQMPSLQQEVRREPMLALDGGADGLDFYRRIVKKLPPHLRPGGSLLFEVGDGQAGDVAALLEGLFEKITTLCDLAGLKRAIVGDGYAG